MSDMKTLMRKMALREAKERLEVAEKMKQLRNLIKSEERRSN